MTVLAAVVLATSLAVVSAAAADPAVSFGSCGNMALDMVADNGYVGEEPVRHLAPLPSGRLLATRLGQFARLLPDGTLDPSFGTYGRALSLGPMEALTLQSDGRMVTAASPVGADTVVVARRLPDGTPDADFGDGGTVVISPGVGGQHAVVALLPDGRIVVANAGFNGSSVVQLRPDGSRDPSFGANGVTRVPGFTPYEPRLAVQPDGKVLLAGTAESPHGDFGLARLDLTGALDPTFGTGGYARLSLEGRQTITGVALDGAGRVITSGRTMRYGYEELLVTRHTPAGSPDPTFATAGVLIERNSVLSPAAVVVEADGSLLVPGTVLGSSRFGVQRFTTNGVLDPQFGASTGLGTPLLAGHGTTPVVARRDDGGWVYGTSPSVPYQPHAIGRARPDGSPYADDTGPTCARSATASPTIRPNLRTDVGSRTAPQVITLTSSGPGPLSVGAVAMIGNGSDQFPVVAENCSGRSLPAGSSCTVSVLFAPTGPGSWSPSLIFFVNAPRGLVTTTFVGVVEPAPSLNQRFAARAYEDLVGRPPGAAVRDQLALRIDSGTSRTAVAQQILTGDDYRAALIEAVVRQYVVRSATADEVRILSDLLQGGWTIELVQAVMLGSDENFARHGASVPAFVSAVYSQVLNRRPTDSERTFWQSWLPVGYPRWGVAYALLNSNEYRGVVIDILYQSFLGRASDPAGREAWLGAMRGGTRLEDVIATFVGTDDYLARV